MITDEQGEDQVVRIQIISFFRLIIFICLFLHLADGESKMFFCHFAQESDEI